MAIVKQVLLTDLDYSAWANQRLLDVCSTLTAEELDRDLGASHGSVAGTLRHIYDAERVWLNQLRATSLPPLSEMGDQRRFQDSPPETGLQELKQQWPEIWEGLHRWIEHLPSEDLDREPHICLPNGEEFHVWKVVRHVVNHSTLHRGQLMGMLCRLGTQPPGTDIMTYYLE
jgi:uncharacterized damage-inducible protein DinB